MRNDIERLRDILEALDRISSRITAGRDDFEKEELLQVWVVHHLEIIGEACAHLSEGIRSRYPVIPWEDVISMRNVLVHQYFGIDIAQVWDTVKNDLPELERSVKAILAEHGEL